MMQRVAIDESVFERGGITAVSADKTGIFTQTQTVAPRCSRHFLRGINEQVLGLGEPTCTSLCQGFHFQRFSISFILGLGILQPRVQSCDGIVKTVHFDVLCRQKIVAKRDVCHGLEKRNRLLRAAQFAQTACVTIGVNVVGRVLPVEFLVGRTRCSPVTLFEEGIRRGSLLSEDRNGDCQQNYDEEFLLHSTTCEYLPSIRSIPGIISPPPTFLNVV